MYLVDTNVISELMRPRPAPRVVDWAGGIDRFALSVVTLEEVWYGLSVRHSVRLERWFNDFTQTYCNILAITPTVARRSAGLRARLRTLGKTRTQADMLIAATAAEHDLILVTRNVRDFNDCGLQLLNPFGP